MRYVTPAKGDGDIFPFGKPKDWDDKNGLCGTLPVRREVETHGGKPYLGLYSNWKPDSDELARLNAGHVVELMCCGTQPAVSVSVVPCADPEVEPNAENLALRPARAMEAIRGAVARGWCHDKNAAKIMDSDLAEAISAEIAKLFGTPYDG